MMILLYFTCTYCYNKWEKSVYSSDSSLSHIKCAKCGDRNVIVKRASEEKVDYYQGSPPFPEKIKKVIPDPYKEPLIEQYSTPWWSSNDMGSLE
jgi:hypothetical protein